MLHRAVGAEVSRAATDVIVARSAGNALFLWEFGQLMAQAGRLDVAPAAVPGAVAAVIERRLARLPQDAVALLQVIAVVGRSCRADVVASIAGVGPGEAMAELRAAVVGGLVTENDPEHFAFSHDLLRDVVLDGIDPRRRVDLHGRAAAVFETRLPMDPSFHAVVADHLSKAGAARTAAASEHWERAGQRARSVLAYDEAAGCFARAASAVSGDPDRYAALLVAQGEALVLAGDLETARARYADAAAAARAVSNPELLARAVLGIGTGPLAWEVPIGDEGHAREVADALALLPDGPKALRSTMLARLSVSGSTPETLDVARRRAEEALELAQEVGDPTLIGQALAALNDALGGPSHTMIRRENSDTIVELAVAAGDRSLELLGYRFRVVADLESGDVAAVDRDIAAFTRLAEGLRQPLVSWFVPLFRGMRALLAGNVEAADRYQLEVAAAARATGSVNASLLATALRFGIDVACGRETAADLMDGYEGVDPAAWGSFAAGLTMVKWHAGHHDAARELLRLHAADGFVRLGEDSDYLIALMCFGRVAAGLDELRAAAALYDLFRPHAGLWIVDGIAACCWGPVYLELARLAIVLGRDAEAREHLAAARDAVAGVGASMLIAEVQALEERSSGRSDGPPEEIALGTGNLFRHDGPFWTLTYGDKAVRIKDAKGLRDLARLLAEPGRELHVLDLARGTGESGAAGAGRAAMAGGDLGELLDARARAEYRRRLAELDDELQDAEACADRVRAERAREEHDFLAAELSAALGLGGRPRRAGDPVERARKAISGRIRLTIGRIEHEHVALGRHLRNAVRTGTYCVDEPENATTWRVERSFWHRYIRCRASLHEDIHVTGGAAMTDTETTEQDLDTQIGAYAGRLFEAGLAAFEAVTVSLGRELGPLRPPCGQRRDAPRARRPCRGPSSLRTGVARATGSRGPHRPDRRRGRPRPAALRAVRRGPRVSCASREPRIDWAAVRLLAVAQPRVSLARRRLPQWGWHPLQRLRGPRRTGRLQPARLPAPAGKGVAATCPRARRPPRHSPGTSCRDRLWRGLGSDRDRSGVAECRGPRVR